MSESGWELGAKLRNLWDERLSYEVEKSLDSLQQQLNEIQPKKIKYKNSEKKVSRI